MTLVTVDVFCARSQDPFFSIGAWSSFGITIPFLIKTQHLLSSLDDGSEHAKFDAPAPAPGSHVIVTQSNL